MFKNNFKKLKAAVCSGILAVTAFTAPLSASFAPAINASAAGNDNYARLLQYSLYFYDANMCGTDVNDKSALTWRSNCHTDDEVPGGYHDAGDHAMFGLPQGFTASVLGWSYYEFKDAYDSTGQTAHYKLIMDRFCDFFKRSTKLSGNSVSSFLYQKGDGNDDHSYWGAPELQPGGRKMFWTSNSASDIAADYAAALAINYINFGNQEDLKYAEALYNFSIQHNKCESNGTSGFYYANGCSPQDEQANAAGWLYLATKNEKYKSDCASKQTQYLGWCDGWDNRGLAAACVYSYITNDWNKVNSYLGTLCNSSNYLCMDDWGSARLNCSVQFTALVATKHGANYGSWCQGQMDYILGNNQFNTCFVTGFASNSAKNVHHRAASGYQGYNPPDGMNEYTTTYHPTKSHVLIGALAGGPDKSGNYSDVMNDYKCNEVAIDYNSGLVGAAAGLYSMYKTGSVDSSIEGVGTVQNNPVTTTSTTTTTTTTSTQQNPNNTTTTTTKNNPNPGTTTTNNNVSSGKYTINPKQSIKYSTLGDDKMFGFAYEDFGLTAGSTEKIKKIEVTISTPNGSIGKWQGAFGSSTKVAADDYWYMTKQQEASFSGNSGTVTWNVDSATADIIQYGYGGQFKFGVWWIDCDDFVIDSITIYTDGTAAATTTTTTTKQTTTTTTTAITTTTTTTTTNNNVSVTLWGDSDLDGKVGISDVVKVMMYVANKDANPISAQGLANSDVYNSGDGVFISDALSIQKKVAQIINSLPEN